MENQEQEQTEKSPEQIIFDEFCEAYEVEVDENDDSFKIHQRRFLKAAKKGTLKLDAMNNVLFTTRCGKTLKFNRGKGSAFVATDKAGKNAHAGSLHYAMGDIAGVAPADFY